MSTERDPGNGLSLGTLIRQMRQDVRHAEVIARLKLAEGDSAEGALAYLLSEVRLDLDLLEQTVEYRHLESLREQLVQLDRQSARRRWWRWAA